MAPAAGVGQDNLKNDVIFCRPTQYAKMFTRAFGARKKYPTIQSKTSQKRKMSRLRLRRAKNGRFRLSVRCDEIMSTFLKCGGFAPNGKIAAGANNNGVNIILQNTTYDRRPKLILPVF